MPEPTPPAPTIREARIVYTQDDHEDVDEQWLTVEVRDEGAGPYLVLQTERWAIDTPEELAALLGRALRLVEPGKGQSA